MTLQQAGGPGRFEAQGPPGFITQADLGEFHGTPRLPASPGQDRPDPPVGPQELADPPLLAHQHPASRTFADLADWLHGEGPLLPGPQVTGGASGRIEDP